MIHVPSIPFPSLAETLDQLKRAASMGRNLSGRRRKLARAKRKKLSNHKRRIKR